jgi:probable phosphoglycerate mutase
LRPLESLSELAQGDWEGRTHAEVRERYPEQLAAWRADPLHHHAPGGESLPDALVRAGLALESILGPSQEVAAPTQGGPPPAEPVLGYERSYGASGPPPWAIVVAHDGILRLLMLSLLGIEIGRFWSFPMALASVSVLDLSAEVARLRAHNLDEHIIALDRS